MELTKERHEAAVTGAATNGCCVSLPLQPAEMADNPCLSLLEERFDSRLGIRPATPGRWRHGHQDAGSWVDGHAQAPGSRRPAYAILDVALTEPEAVGGLWLEDDRVPHRGTS